MGATKFVLVCMKEAKRMECRLPCGVGGGERSGDIFYRQILYEERIMKMKKSYKAPPKKKRDGIFFLFVSYEKGLKKEQNLRGLQERSDHKACFF